MATADFTSDVVVRRPEPGQMRIGAHADSNGFTIVRLDGRPGLEVRIADSEGTRHWVPVSLPEGSPDALVVNTGRMIERWTGGHFKAAIHRVVLDGDVRRLWLKIRRIVVANSGQFYAISADELAFF